jgi:hypothetical protein
MRKLLREPFVHFVLLGVLLFIGHSLWARHASEDARTIFVSEEEMERQALIFAGENRRVPTDDDLTALLYSYVEEEALVREAKTRGFGEDDTIIRRRLAQKMRFLIEDVDPPKKPDDIVLKSWFENNLDSFISPARTSFRHVYFSPESGEPSARASKILSTLSASNDGAALGDPFIMKREFKEVTQIDMARLFGPEFSQRLSKLEVGDWEGPVESAFGVHLVKLTSRSEARTPSFDEVKNDVAKAWLEQAQREDNARRLKELVTNYKVKVAGE